jgi:hypothetical protein
MKQIDGSQVFPCVHFYKRTNSYRAQVTHNHKKISLGYRPTPEKAFELVQKFKDQNQLHK